MLKPHQRMLLLLFGLFLLPIVAAWIFSAKLVDPRQFGLVNHGNLLDPPIELADATWLDTAYPNGIPAAHWVVAEFYDPSDCDDTCDRVFQHLSALPLVMGQEGPRITNLGVTLGETGCEQPDYPHCAALPIDEFDAVTRTIAERAGMAPELPLVAFIDWRRNLMIAYPNDFDPNHVKKDLKRLLKASRR